MYQTIEQLYNKKHEPSHMAVWRKYDTLSRRQKKNIIHKNRREWVKVRNSFYGSREWIEFRWDFLESHNKCEVCGCTKSFNDASLQVHHKEPYNMDVNSLNEKIVDMLNHLERFAVICADCHLLNHYPILKAELENGCFDESEGLRLAKALLDATERKQPKLLEERINDMVWIAVENKWNTDLLK